MKERTPRNGFEYRVRDNLASRGIDFDYESEKLKYQSKVVGGVCTECGCKTAYQNRTYTPDFIIIRHDQSKLYVETKGKFPSTDRSKMRDVAKSNPGADIRILFTTRSKPQMADVQKWCDKFNFYCAFGHEVPENWL